MRDTRLILIDGLPGSGKSTTAEHLTVRLRSLGFDVRLLPECQDNHPLNVGGRLHPSGDTLGQAFFEQYSPEALIAESLQRWQRFAEQQTGISTVTIAESYPFQNSSRVLFQMNTSFDQVQDHAAEVAALISGLNPILIYFDHSATQPLETIYKQRGPEWVSYFVSVVTDCAYAKARDLHGLDGALTLIEEYRNLMNALRLELSYPVLALRDCHDDWQACHETIDAFLELTEINLGSIDNTHPKSAR